MARVAIPLVVQAPSSGSAIAGASVQVNRHSDAGAASLFTSEGGGTAASNPITTDAYGGCTESGGQVWVGQGTYDFVISGTGLTTRTITRELVSADYIGQAGQVGEVILYPYDTLPTGFLRCDGSAVNRSDYPKLHALAAAAGYPHGNGNGTTTFNVPDLRQRFYLGKSGSGTGSTLGGTGGSVDHAHTVASHSHSVPAHYHGFGDLGIASAGSHDHGGVTGPMNANNPHNHPLGLGAYAISDGTNNSGWYGGSGYYKTVNTLAGVASQDISHGHSISSGGSHSHSLSGSYVGNNGGSNGDAAMTSGNASPATDAANPPFMSGHFLIRHGEQ